MKWNEMTDQEQVYLWWEFQAGQSEDEEPITFEDFDEMMRGAD